MQLQTIHPLPRFPASQLAVARVQHRQEGWQAEAKEGAEGRGGGRRGMPRGVPPHPQTPCSWPM